MTAAEALNEMREYGGEDARNSWHTWAEAIEAELKAKDAEIERLKVFLAHHEGKRS